MSEATPPPTPPVWVVLRTFLLAAVTILAASVVAGMVLHSLDPDRPPVETLQSIRGLVAGALASASALVLTLGISARNLTLARLRLVPGRERGRDLLAAVVGMLALGQALDSATTLVGLSDDGSMAVIRKALQGVSGPELFFAIIAIGIVAGGAEEVFFRGYMQSMLRERWRPALAIAVTSVCFGALHLDPVHAPLAIALGAYLGHVTERAGSALPAVVCHVVNNAVYTMLTATLGSWDGRDLVSLGLAATLVFVGCLAFLRRSLPSTARP
jgi:membrane protease YdiL (CAAX protease family)